jgi:predicted dehydrogenase
MKSEHRRTFLKQLGLGTGVLAWGINGCKEVGKVDEQAAGSSEQRVQTFNMCGYAAPGIDTVRIGLIGLGNRGSGAFRRLSRIQNTEIVAVSDKLADRVQKAQDFLVGVGLAKPQGYHDGTEDWMKMCEREDIDLVYICTPWALHTPMAVYAMKQGKHVAVEVPAAINMDEAWQLVETSERTRKHCMMLENCCYDFFELLTLNLARQGYFGELVHAEGAYIHTLLESMFRKTTYVDMWRLKENRRNGNLYPTHGLGPVCQAMNINRGDAMDYLTAVSTDDFQMRDKARELQESDSFYNEHAGVSYRGNMNTSVIRTKKGKTIMVQHDVTSTRPYSRIHLLSGTKGIARKYPEPGRISIGHDWLSEEEVKKLEQEYTPEIVTFIGEAAKKVGGHGGMDFIMDWRLIDCLRNGLPLDQDVYDAALWSSVTPLSEWSVANRSNSIDVPDFTCGAWKDNQPHDLTLAGGATTEIRNV